MQLWKDLAPALVLALRTDRVIPLFNLSEQDGSDGTSSFNKVKINKLFFTKNFVGQQTDLEHHPISYWQPMKRTKQGNTASKWK